VALAALSAPAFASATINGAVGGVPAADNVKYAGSAAVRIYSVAGADLGENTNGCGIGACLGCTAAPNTARCVRPYNSANTNLGGGYVSQNEDTGQFNGDADEQTFYALWDAEANKGACNHQAFYAVQGQKAATSNATDPLDTTHTGERTIANCGGTVGANCFKRADASNSDTSPITFSRFGYDGTGGSAHSFGSVGGFNPVPNVRVSLPGAGCAAGSARLTWDDPDLQSGAMKNGVTSPVQGVNLYVNTSVGCDPGCPNGETGWSLQSTTECPGGVCGMIGATGTCVNITGPTWFALRVRVKGPGSAATSIESGNDGPLPIATDDFVGGNSSCVAPAGTAVRITNVTAHYAGRGTVNVTWTTGTEGGVQGYYVSRGTSPSGPFTRVSEEFTPRGDQSTYQFADSVHAALGRIQYYAIEIVSTDGTSDHTGPQAVNLPAAKRRFGAR